MIYPENNKLAQRFFHYYIQWMIRRNFKQINFNKLSIDQSKSVLLLANHFSWWDGFILYYLNIKLLKKKFYIMVLKDTMQKGGFFKYMGAFSVSKKSRNVVNSLAYAAQLLNDPKNVVVIFPQGKLHSNFVTKVLFEKGVIKITEQATGKFQLITAGTFIENFEHKKPSAYIYLNTVANNAFENITQLNNIYQQHYTAAHTQQSKIVL